MAGPKVHGEREIRSTFGGGTGKILDRWHETCKRHKGFDVDVAVANRANFPGKGNFAGEPHSSIPRVIDGEPVLVVLVEDVGSVLEERLCHEVIRWILFLEGFQYLRDGRNPGSNIELMLNQLALHPALYSMQKDLGQPIQEYVDDKAEATLEEIEKRRRSDDDFSALGKAFRVADDFKHCSGSIKGQIFKEVKKHHDQTYTYVNKILAVEEEYNLGDSQGHINFLVQCSSELGMEGDWKKVDRARELMSS